MARIVLPGYFHHVTQRGVRSIDIFHSDLDRKDYLNFLLRQGKRFGLKYLAYCLMSNHVHLVVIPKSKDSLSLGIGEAHRLYTRTINSREGVKGYLFQGRFFSCPLDERHLLAAVRYIERNPVRAGIVKKPWDYKWSSARFHVGLIKKDTLLAKREVVHLIDDWKEFLKSDPIEIDSLREKSRTGRPCGDIKFVKRAEKLTGRQLHPKLAGRPSKNKKPNKR